MLITLSLIFISILFIMFASEREPIRWTHRLRRFQVGLSCQAECVAPDAVIYQAGNDYLSAIEWLTRAALGKHTQHAPEYLTGRFLTHFQTIVNYQLIPGHALFVGVMTSQHHIQVPHFSEDGGRCLVVDTQTERRMKSRKMNNHEWLLKQDLGDGALVFQLPYDARVQRWTDTSPLPNTLRK